MSRIRLLIENQLVIDSKITENGFIIYFNGNQYENSYPKEVWKKFPTTLKQPLVNNLSVITTSQLPMAMNKDSIMFSSRRPKTFDFRYQDLNFEQNSLGILD